MTAEVSALERAGPRRHLVEHRRRTRRDRSERRGFRRAPAPATCRRPCPRVDPGLVMSAMKPPVATAVTPDRGRPLGQLGQTEVEHLCLPGAGHEDVRRLDVAVHDAAGVRAVERVGDLDRRARAAARRAAACRRSGASRVVPSSSSITMNGSPLVLRRFRGSCRCAGDSGTRPRGPRAGSARARPCRARYRPAGTSARQADRARVLGAVDDTHPAAAKLLRDTVVRTTVRPTISGPSGRMHRRCAAGPPSNVRHPYVGSGFSRILRQQERYVMRRWKRDWASMFRTGQGGGDAGIGATPAASRLAAA